MTERCAICGYQFAADDPFDFCVQCGTKQAEVPLDIGYIHGDPATADVLVVLLHGHGQPDDHLWRTGERIMNFQAEIGKSVAVILPQGPVEEDDGLGWWTIPASFSDMKTYKDVLRVKITPPLSLVKRLVTTVCEYVPRAEDTTRKPPILIIGGFGHSAILASHCMLALRKKRIASCALVTISSVLDRNCLKEAANLVPDGFKNLKIFQVHGEDDDEIPEMLIHHGNMEISDLADQIACSIDITTCFHEGGHELHLDLFKNLKKWMVSDIASLPGASFPPELAIAPRAHDENDEKALADEESEAMQLVNSPSQLNKKQGSSSLKFMNYKGRSDNLREISSPKKLTHDPFAFDRGDFCEGDVVRLRNLPNPSHRHLNGTRATIEFWDAQMGVWEVELQSGRRTLCVKPENLKLHVREDALRANVVANQKLSPRRVQEIMDLQIPSYYDAPQLQRHMWGATTTNYDQSFLAQYIKGDIEDAELEEIANTPCLVFGRQQGINLRAPVVILFRGNSHNVIQEMAPLAAGYVNGVGARVVLPLTVPKTSQLLHYARAIANGMLGDISKGPLMVHGVFTGAIPAVQVAVEGSFDDNGMRECSLLVLSNPISSLSQIPGALGVLGQLTNDPFNMIAKVKAIRCPIALVRGTSKEDLIVEENPAIPAHLRAYMPAADSLYGPKPQEDSLQVLAKVCLKKPAMIDLESGVDPRTGDLVPDLLNQVQQAMMNFINRQ